MECPALNRLGQDYRSQPEVRVSCPRRRTYLNIPVREIATSIGIRETRRRALQSRLENTVAVLIPGRQGPDSMPGNCRGKTTTRLVVEYYL